VNATITTSSARPVAWTIGIAGFAACVFGWITTPREFFLAYLFGYLVWLGVALGSLGFLMIHHLTGGSWGYPVRRIFEAAISTLPILAILFVPILFGLRELYPWADAANVASDKILQHKHAYMNATSFIIRAAIMFAIWIFITRLLTKWSDEQDTTRSVEPTKKLRRLSGPGLVIYPLTVTFAYVDWVMSMEADWYSTVFPLLICIGQMLSALAFVVILIGFSTPSPQSSPKGRGSFDGSKEVMQASREKTGAFSRREKVGMRAPDLPNELQSLLGKERFHHLGNLLLAFTMMWAYLAYSQLIVIWSGDLPHEIAWYLHRIAGGWRWIAIVLLLFHFFGPFAFLLFRATKRSAKSLVAVAAIIFTTHVIDVWWLLAPSIYPSGFHLSWLAFAALFGIGGIWFAAFLKKIESQPLIPLNDPRFAVATTI
jgi:MFS family permease